MDTVYRRADLLNEKQDLEKRLKNLQNNRAKLLRSAMSKDNNESNSEIEELTLQLEKVDWKLNALF